MRLYLRLAYLALRERVMSGWVLSSRPSPTGELRTHLGNHLRRAQIPFVTTPSTQWNLSIAGAFSVVQPTSLRSSGQARSPYQQMSIMAHGPAVLLFSLEEEILPITRRIVGLLHPANVPEHEANSAHDHVLTSLLLPALELATALIKVADDMAPNLLSSPSDNDATLSYGIRRSLIWPVIVHAELKPVFAYFDVECVYFNEIPGQPPASSQLYSQQEGMDWDNTSQFRMRPQEEHDRLEAARIRVRDEDGNTELGPTDQSTDFSSDQDALRRRLFSEVHAIRHALLNFFAEWRATFPIPSWPADFTSSERAEVYEYIRQYLHQHGDLRMQPEPRMQHAIETMNEDEDFPLADDLPEAKLRQEIQVQCEFVYGV